VADTLKGYRIALAEGRQLEELAQMLEQEAAVLRCPMLKIVDAPDPAPVVAWLRDLVDGRFSHVILMTGEGLRRLLKFAEREGIRDACIRALGQTRIVTRGPKPVRALKEVGLGPSGPPAIAPTTEGLIAGLRQEPLSGRTVGVQLYPEANVALTDFLVSVGATVQTVMPYVYAPAANEDEVLALIDRMAGRTVDVIVFTSSPQIDRLYQVAAECGVLSALQEGMSHTLVAAIGPVVADNLRRRGARVDICPDRGFVMKNLVQQIKRAVSPGPR
jgi:uroporphyrinogen-III synthase